VTYWQWLRQFGRLKNTLLCYVFMACRAVYHAIRGDVIQAATFLAAVPILLAIHLLVAWDVYRRARRYHESIGDARPATE
jgi:hypothetical protein